MLKAPATPASRAGAYRRQPQGYRAFIPAKLPANPPIRIEGRVQALLSRADLALGRLAGSIETLPNPDLFVLMYVRKEAVLSSQIEGTQSSLQDVLAAEARVFAPHQPQDVAEVLNYVAAINHGLDRLRHITRLGPPDPGNPCQAAGRRARLPPDPRRAPHQPELDRPRGLLAE